MKITLATSQFFLSNDIAANLKTIRLQMKQASKAGCDIIHFPEGALSGYAGIDFASFDGFDWNQLKKATYSIMEFANQLNIFVVLGSSHYLPNHKPFNSLYIINNQGELIDRYDKRFCAGDPHLQNEDLAHFSSGNHCSIFKVKGILCGVLICHEYRYPELYRQLKSEGVQLVFHSYHAGNMNNDRKKEMESVLTDSLQKINDGSTLPEITMPATMISYAANNYLWISASNTSAKESCWASFVVRPDGITVGKLIKNKEDILITTLDTKQNYYDATKYWRERAIEGVFYSGEQINDSSNRTKL